MNSASPDIQIFFGAGSPLTEITNYITSDISLATEGIFIDGTAYGHTSTQNRAVGVTDTPDVTLADVQLSNDAMHGGLAAWAAAVCVN